MNSRPPIVSPHILESRRFRAVRVALQALSRVSPDVAAQVAIRLFTAPNRHAPRPWELEFLQSAVPLSPACPGLHAVVWGAGNAPTVLMIHGWEGRASQMGAFAAPLVQAGFRVVSMDAPAHGKSGGRRSNPLIFMEALLKMGAHLGPLHAVMGHSMGGAASVIARSRGLAVGRVLMLGSPSRLSRVVRGFPGFLGLSPKAGAAFVQRVQRQIGDEIESVDPLTLAPRLAAEGNTTLLAIHDPADAEVPFADAASLVAAWPGATLVSLDAGGHRRMLRHPGVIAAAVRGCAE